jgi:AmiR/NasT family two-component response regulator
MERERLDDQEAFTHLRRAARSSGRKLTEVAHEVAAGKPLPPRTDQTGEGYT